MTRTIPTPTNTDYAATVRAIAGFAGFTRPAAPDYARAVRNPLPPVSYAQAVITTHRSR